jgi:hypothetical protein
MFASQKFNYLIVGYSGINFFLWFTFDQFQLMLSIKIRI